MPKKNNKKSKERKMKIKEKQRKIQNETTRIKLEKFTREYYQIDPDFAAKLPYQIENGYDDDDDGYYNGYYNDDDFNKKDEKKIDIMAALRNDTRLF